MEKEWLDSLLIFEKYQNEGEHWLIDAGIQIIDPKKIIALSRKPVERKMNILKESVKRHGWRDVSPQDLDILELPNKEYIVVSGGNHRAVLSNEMGLEQIKVKLTVLLPKRSTNKKQNDMLVELNKAIDELDKKTHNESNRSRKFMLIDRADELRDERNSFLYRVYQSLKSM